MTEEGTGAEKQCGIDEAGRGPVFGPMVMSIVCGDRQSFSRMRVRDSKVLSPSRREQLFEMISEQAEFYRYVIITPSELNKLMNTMTLNEIELLHAADLLSGARYVTYVDCFDVKPQRSQSELIRRTGKDVVCAHHADAIYPAVSAASILSKVIRDREIEKISEKYGNIGSGYPSDPKTIDFLRDAVARNTDLSEIVRIHWKTYKDVLKNNRTSRLF